jgi:hypothetical protein
VVMTAPHDAAPLGDKLDKLYGRIVAVLEREPGIKGGAAPGDSAPEPEPELETLHYSRGRDKYDSFPQQRSAASFEDFAEAVLSDRSAAKGLTWISGPFAPNSDGRHHRCRDGALPRRFIAFDLDGATPPGFAELCMMLGEFSGFGYTTASHTTENPHARLILELSRSVDRAEGVRLGAAMQRQIEARLGPGAVQLDPSVYRAEQPIFGPLLGADVMRYDGDPVQVDEVLKDAPSLEESPSRSGRAAAIASRDPVVRALTDRGMIKRDHGDGKLPIVCPFEVEHTEPGVGNATAYLLPNFGGVKYGKFTCLHAHCEGRQHEDFIRALGLDPREVWRAQAGGAAPSVESYGEAAQEDAWRHTEGEKASGGGSPADCESRVILLRGDALRVEPIRWLWDGWLARSKLHILAGPPGAGKSAIAITLGAVVTVGGRWPDGTKCAPGHVVVWSGEDDPADTLLPRLLAAGGDPRRFHIVSATVDRDGPRQFDPATDIPALLTAAREIPE